MTIPVRLRLSREKGFNLQAVSQATNGLPAVNCARPSKWGNPWTITREAPNSWRVHSPQVPGAPVVPGRLQDTELEARIVAVGRYEAWVTSKYKVPFSELRGKNLACHCKPTDICHVDILLRLANR